ncbi:MAG: DUF3097 domain-containing protein [Mycobacteriales bacterium]
MYDGIDLAAPKRVPPPATAAERGLVVEEVLTGWCGAVVACDKENVSLEDRRGKVRVFPLGVFLLEGKPVTLVRPVAATPVVKRISSSGSIAVEGLRARVARGSRIWVEGKHDAELVERVWGHDLRVEGVVVEPLDGIDDLAAHVRAFRPGPQQRLGVLVDHLVPGSKESRIVAQVDHPHVLVLGHPYVDVWEAVKPAAAGIPRWPDVPRGQDWKTGVCRELGWGETWEGWQRVLSKVNSYADLEVPLLQCVEHLIDFVTASEA